MSRIGKKTITIPSGVTITREGNLLSIVGPKGKMQMPVNEEIDINLSATEIHLTPKNKAASSLWGLARTLAQNAVTGVTQEWTKGLELVGVGYRAQTDGKKITLSLGFSHPVIIDAPQGVTFAVAENKITISGVDKYLIGEMAAKIRDLKPPEPYKGKGIRYVGEKVKKKAGKAAKAVGGAPGGK
jgi:large subunit ribosomal protein L6